MECGIFRRGLDRAGPAEWRRQTVMPRRQERRVLRPYSAHINNTSRQ